MSSDSFSGCFDLKFFTRFSKVLHKISSCANLKKMLDNFQECLKSRAMSLCLGTVQFVNSGPVSDDTC